MNMTPERWQLVEQIFDAAKELRPAEAASFLHEKCGDDRELEREVASLLEYHRARSSSPGENGGGTQILDASRPPAFTGASGELKPGAKFGPWQILSLIGAGGMGQVWKARDTRLDRIVAIKTSIARFSERFEREARAVAALNHPHICTLYDVGPDYLVMEYVDGTEIKGPLPLDQALKYAIQLAGALEAAHRKGIIHRDLKPANILLTKAGVKVLDFGLAKVEQPTGPTPDDQTAASPLTQEGAIVGTLQYMAPEQLQGGNTDARADIFSFGCVLYEMLTGKRAFDGANTVSLIAAILERPAPSVAQVAPTGLDWALQRCLAKDPDERWQSARDLRAALERVAESGAESAAPAGQRPRAGWIAAAVFALIAITAAVPAFLYFHETPPAARAVRSLVPIPENTIPVAVALSPDGSRLAAVLFAEAKRRLYVRPLDSPAWGPPLADTDDASHPFWSPDGKFIGFFADGKLKTISANGGPPQVLYDAVTVGRGTWNRDGIILFSPGDGTILRVNASGGACTPIAKGEPGSDLAAPQFLPDGRHFLYIVDELVKSGVFLASLDDTKGRRLISIPSNSTGAVYAPPPPGDRYSYLLFLRDKALVAQPFVAGKVQLAGDPVVIAERGPGPYGGYQAGSATGNGLLVYAGYLSGEFQLTWFDRTGKDLGKVGSPNLQAAISLSPDGKTIAIYRDGLRLRNLVRDSETRLAEGEDAVWSPDGSHVIYFNDKDLSVRDAAGASPEIAVFRNNNDKFPSDWSRDGRYLLYTEIDAKTPTKGDIWYLTDPLGKTGAGKPVRYRGTSANESQAQFSPDGHWVAYYSDESGQGEIYIRPFPSGPDQWKVSVSGGIQPRWSPNGREIYYLEPGFRSSMVAASVRTGRGSGLEIGAPQKLFEFRADNLRSPEQNVFAYSPAGDGRFLVNITADTGTPTINLISNWQKLLGGANP